MKPPPAAATYVDRSIAVAEPMLSGGSTNKFACRIAHLTADRRLLQP
jgi:hypothetical protein